MGSPAAGPDKPTSKKLARPESAATGKLRSRKRPGKTLVGPKFQFQTSVCGGDPCGVAKPPGLASRRQRSRRGRSLLQRARKSDPNRAPRQGSSAAARPKSSAPGNLRARNKNPGKGSTLRAARPKSTATRRADGGNSEPRGALNPKGARPRPTPPGRPVRDEGQGAQGRRAREAARKTPPPEDLGPGKRKHEHQVVNE